VTPELELRTFTISVLGRDVDWLSEFWKLVRMQMVLPRRYSPSSPEGRYNVVL
jgi:hypothetical protein